MKATEFKTIAKGAASNQLAQAFAAASEHKRLASGTEFSACMTVSRAALARASALAKARWASAASA